MGFLPFASPSTPPLPPPTLAHFAYPFFCRVSHFGFLRPSLMLCVFCFRFSGAVPGCGTMQRAGRTLVSEAAGRSFALYYGLGPLLLTIEWRFSKIPVSLFSTKTGKTGGGGDF